MLTNESEIFFFGNPSLRSSLSLPVVFSALVLIFPRQLSEHPWTSCDKSEQEKEGPFPSWLFSEPFSVGINTRDNNDNSEVQRVCMATLSIRLTSLHTPLCEVAIIVTGDLASH